MNFHLNFNSFPLFPQSTTTKPHTNLPQPQLHSQLYYAPLHLNLRLYFVPLPILTSPPSPSTPSQLPPPQPLQPPPTRLPSPTVLPFHTITTSIGYLEPVDIRVYMPTARHRLLHPRFHNATHPKSLDVSTITRFSLDTYVFSV